MDTLTKEWIGVSIPSKREKYIDPVINPSFKLLHQPHPILHFTLVWFHHILQVHKPHSILHFVFIGFQHITQISRDILTIFHFVMKNRIHIY